MEEEKNAMEELEQKMEESKREMQIADALDEIRTRNARIERGEKGGKEDQALAMTRAEVDQRRMQEEADLEEAARLAFTRQNIERVRLEEQQDVEGEQMQQEESKKAVPSFEKVARPRKANGIPLVKKSVAEPIKPPEAPKATAPTGLGLGAYGSDDDDD